MLKSKTKENLKSCIFFTLGIIIGASVVGQFNEVDRALYLSKEVVADIDLERSVTTSSVREIEACSPARRFDYSSDINEKESEKEKASSSALALEISQLSTSVSNIIGEQLYYSLIGSNSILTAQDIKNANDPHLYLSNLFVKSVTYEDDHSPEEYSELDEVEDDDNNSSVFKITLYSINLEIHNFVYIKVQDEINRVTKYFYKQRLNDENGNATIYFNIPRAWGPGTYTMSVFSFDERMGLLAKQTINK